MIAETEGRVARPRVVDFSTHFSGPLASQLLAQLGADVIKVENPRTGDGNRGLKPRIDDLSMAHLSLNSGTRSLAIDRRSPQWASVVAAAARWADVAIVGAQPESARRRGLDAPALFEANPELVYCRVSAYGESGPWAGYPAHGLNVDALAGLVPIEAREGGPIPREDYKSVGMTAAAVHAALGVMAALYRREREGGPQVVTVSMWGAAMWWNWRQLAAQANTGAPWRSYSALGSRYCLYGTADGRNVLVCPTERRFWVAFCEALELSAELAERGDWEASGMDYGYDDEKPLIAERIGARTLDEVTALLARAGVPFAPMLTFTEALESDHARSQGVMRPVTVNGGLAMTPAAPVHINADAGPQDVAPGPPALGEHTRELLAELGLDVEALA